MNSKYHDYFKVGKNKNLIEKHALTEDDLLLFKKLKIYEIDKQKKSGIIITLIGIFFILLASSINLVASIVSFVFFAIIDLWIMKNCLSLKHSSPEYCDYGIVTDKFIEKDRGDDTNHYIIITANNNLIKFKRTRHEYDTIKINDEVVLFAIEDKNELLFDKKIY